MGLDAPVKSDVQCLAFLWMHPPTPLLPSRFFSTQTSPAFDIYLSFIMPMFVTGTGVRKPYTLTTIKEVYV